MSNDNNGPRIPRSVIDSGIIALIIVSIGFSGYMINQALEIQTKTDKKIDEMSKNQQDFVNRWDQRIKVSNTINNGTRDVIKNQVVNILNNLSAHRIITNKTFDQVKEIQNDTETMIKALNNTNEISRLEAVKNITNDLHINRNIIKQNNEILQMLAKHMNITLRQETNETKTSDNIQKLLDILNRTQ